MVQQSLQGMLYHETALLRDVTLWKLIPTINHFQAIPRSVKKAKILRNDAAHGIGWVRTFVKEHTL